MKRLKLCFVCLLWPVFFCTSAYAGGGPENVLLLVNANSESSKLIANEYIQMREIHPRNVVYLEAIPDKEVIAYEDFKRFIVEPVLRVVQLRKLAGQISYIVYSSDFPTKIVTNDQRKMFFELIEKESGRQVGNPKVFLPGASLTSLTYFLPKVVVDDPSYMALNANYYARRRNVGVLKRPFFGDTQIKFDEAIQLVRREKYDRAESLLLELHKAHPQQAAVSYWLARRYGLEGKVVDAVEWIKKAADSGWAYRDEIAIDLSFAKIARDELFKQTLESLPNFDFTFLPTRSFEPNLIWGPNGMTNGDFKQGSPYFLSTILGVTRNEGNSEVEVVEQLRRTVAADYKKPNGTFYFSSHKGIRSTTRKSEFDSTVRSLKRMGLKARVVSERMPSRKSDIAGLMLGTARFDFGASKSRILPGAICENLTSYGGIMSPKFGQTKTSELIRYGAAGASGTVIEPLALKAKFPHPNIHVHYARGCTLAEAFYQSVEGPFQLLIVGDALCQPFATPPRFTVTGLDNWDTVSGSVDLKFDDSESLVPIAYRSLFLNGALINNGIKVNEVSFDTRSLPDGFHELRIVSTADTTARPTARKIIPFIVNNQNSKIELRASKTQCAAHETIQIDVSSNVGEQVRLIQNYRTLASQKLIDGRALIDLPARFLGRGNSKLIAVVSHDGKQLRSKPGWIQVRGKISKEIREQNRVPQRLARNNADHLAIVRFKRGVWSVSNDFRSGPAWSRFVPEPGDRLLAKVDLAKDEITSLEGQNKQVGIVQMQLGFASGDLEFFANRWAFEPEIGEFSVQGRYFETEDGRRVDVGPLNLGVAANDLATGDGYLLYSKRNVHERFSNSGLLHDFNSKHFVVVRNFEGKWQWYTNNREFGWLEFGARPGDQIIAELELTKNTAKMLKGQSSQVNGIGLGFEASDLTIQPNVRRNKPKPGNFMLEGSFFTLADGTRVEVGGLGLGLAVTRGGEGKAFLMYSREPVHNRF